MIEKGQTIISFSEENKQKIEENKRKKKHTGRFRVTIDTYESPTKRKIYDKDGNLLCGLIFEIRKAVKIR